MLIKVMNVEAKILNEDLSLTCVKNSTKFKERSKIVWRHVNAIVKPRVIIIKSRSCCLNSVLFFINLLILCLILIG